MSAAAFPHLLPPPEILSQFTDGPEDDFIWFRTWMVRREYLKGLSGVADCLRHIPGLRKRMIVALWNGNRLDPKVRHRFPFSCDALQIAENGNRARSFSITRNKTVKAVSRHSRYGENTSAELAVRLNILPKSDIKVPRILHHEQGDDYIRFEEEMVRGRIYSHWRDAPRFWGEIGAPLMKVCDAQGIDYKPLSEVLDQPFISLIMGANTVSAPCAAAKALLERNPIVAAGFSHGDTVSSNMIVGADGLYLVDWEPSARRYAGFDFARLAMRYPWSSHYAQAAKDVFDRYQQGRFTLADANIIRRGVAAVRKLRSV